MWSGRLKKMRKVQSSTNRRIAIGNVSMAIHRLGFMHQVAYYPAIQV